MYKYVILILGGIGMFVLFIILNEIDYIEDILSGFVENEISGATILESQGMGSAIANSNNESIPLFSTLRMLIGDSDPYSKTIFTVLENETMVDKAVSVVQGVLSDIKDTGIGFMFTVPVSKVYSIKKD
jgi:nitrogen regulatory protein PII